MIQLMATIQIRDVPEDAYETIRRRARADGKSLQSYMRERVVEFAARPSKAELAEAIEAALREHRAAGSSGPGIADDVAAERR